MESKRLPIIPTILRLWMTWGHKECGTGSHGTVSIQPDVPASATEGSVCCFLAQPDKTSIPIYKFRDISVPCRTASHHKRWYYPLNYKFDIMGFHFPYQTINRLPFPFHLAVFFWQYWYSDDIMLNRSCLSCILSRSTGCPGCLQSFDAYQI